MTIIVSGYSDDIIKIEGDFDRTFTLPSIDATYLVFSTGLALKIEYDGDWNISKISKHEHSEVTIEHAGEHDLDGIRPYSDAAIIKGPAIEWVAQPDVVSKVTSNGC